MFASLAAAAALAQSQDVMVGVVVRSPQGDLATFAATMIGTSRRMTTKVGAGWIHGPKGWTWFQSERDGVAYGAPGERKTLPLPSREGQRAGEEWRITWISESSLSLGLADWQRRTPLTDIRQIDLVPNPPALAEPKLVSERLQEAFDALPRKDREALSPLTPEPGSGGYLHREGRLHWGVRLSSAQQVGNDPQLLWAPVDRQPSTVWSTARSISPQALAAIAEEAAQWGFLITADEVKLAPFRSGRFSPPVRLQSWNSEAVVAWWAATEQVEERDAELRRAAPGRK